MMVIFNTVTFLDWSQRASCSSKHQPGPSRPLRRAAWWCLGHLKILASCMMASTNVSLQDPDKVEHTADQRLSFTGLLSSCVHGVSREVFPAGPCLKMTHKISHRATRSQILLRLLCCLTDRNVTNLITSSAIDFSFLSVSAITHHHQYIFRFYVQKERNVYLFAYETHSN